MDRRRFLATTSAGAAGLGGGVLASSCGRDDSDLPDRPQEPQADTDAALDGARALFPRASEQVFLNAAGGTPLSRFSERGLTRYLEFARHGPGRGRAEYVNTTRAEVANLFARLIGARPSEIGLVHCTKAGEQVVLDGLDSLRSGANVVTNDLHFTGSLHNLVGLRNSGVDVRIVKADGFAVDPNKMAEAIDDRTALVTVSLVSNINGHVEAMPELSRLAHAHGALVFADIIQAAGCAPIDVEALGIDFAACSAYKWLFGVHGVGFLYVRDDLQGTALTDRIFPGHVIHNYEPWAERIDPAGGDYLYRPPVDAHRYQPGHISYLGYAAAYEALRYLMDVGVDRVLAHSVHLIRRLSEQLDPDRYRSLSPEPGGSGIVTFDAADPTGLRERLTEAGVVIGLAGPDGGRLRVSPSVYNTDRDVDRLAEVLTSAAP